MKILFLVFAILHLLSHVIPSAVMLWHMIHMRKIHGTPKWKLIWTMVWIVVTIGTMIELPDMIHSLTNQCG